jgi:hypothetical protein
VARHRIASTLWFVYQREREEDPVIRALIEVERSLGAGRVAADAVDLRRVIRNALRLIGYGLWGRYHADAIVNAPGAELAAIACASEPTAAAARKAFPDVAVFTDYRELLARKPELALDAVDIVVPNHLHAESGSPPSTQASTCCSKSRWRPASPNAMR